MIRESNLVAVYSLGAKSCLLWDRKPRVRVSRKKIDENKLYDKIKQLILLNYNSDNRFCTVNAEDVALELRVRLGQVRKVFMRLNREGILSHKKKRFAHDTNRNRMFYGRASGWASNYYIVSEKIKEIENG